MLKLGKPISRKLVSPSFGGHISAAKNVRLWLDSNRLDQVGRNELCRRFPHTGSCPWLCLAMLIWQPASQLLALADRTCVKDGFIETQLTPTGLKPNRCVSALASPHSFGESRMTQPIRSFLAMIRLDVKMRPNPLVVPSRVTEQVGADNFQPRRSTSNPFENILRFSMNSVFAVAWIQP